MASEFERRISAAANRKSTPRPLTAEEQRVSLVKAAIADWHGHIGPMIEQAVAAANQQLANAGLQLKISKDIEHGVKPGGGATVTPMRPVISIFSETGPAPAAASPARIRIGMQEDARIFVAAHHCTIPERPAVASSQMDKPQIRDVIADYVDTAVAHTT
jgi:hypothetical protein